MALAGALGLLASGCALLGQEEPVTLPSQSPVVMQWSAAMRELGRFPVLPPNEDVYVGDLYAFATPPETGEAPTSLRTDANTRWGSLPVLAPLDGEYRLRPQWNRSGEEQVLFQADRIPLRHRIVDLEIAAAATLSISELTPFLPIEVAPLLGVNAESDLMGVSFRAPGAESYSLSVDALMEELLVPSSQGDRDLRVLNPEYRTSLALVAGGNSGRAYLGVVSEVLYMRSLDATLRHRGLPPSKTEASEETTAAIRRAAELNEALERSDIAPGLEDSIEFVSVTDHALSLRRTWPEPPAIGVRGLMLEVDVNSGEVLRTAPLGVELPPLELVVEEDRDLDESAVLEERLRGATAKGGEPRSGVYWDVGPRFDALDGELSLFLGGRLHLDAATFSEDDEIDAAFGEPDEGTEIRRAFLELAGVYKLWEFNFWVDFADGTDFRNVFVGRRGIPYVDSVRAGYFKEPFGLEETTSSNDITFMERSLTDAFIERRNLGVSFQRRFANERRATMALGVYKQADNELDTGTDVGITGRLTGAPILSEDDRRLLHIGASATYRDPGSDGVQFNQRPESNLAQVLANTGVLEADTDARLGLELAGNIGSLSLQTEAIAAHLGGVPGSGDPTFFSAYVMGSYVLTGETRSYRERVGAFGSVHPSAPFAGGGIGAFELATRYSYLDLDSAGVEGGRLHDWTLGLNWYANLNMRMMVNYIAAHPEGFDFEHILQVRLQLSF